MLDKPSCVLLASNVATVVEIEKTVIKVSKVINPKFAICCYDVSPGFGYGLRM
ncbi:20739_t:CDS:2, partial [Gigaspora rosea]